jgi:DNA-binding beta-propeller fold protein YncE
VASAPEASEATVVAASDGVPRFTPTVAGDYRLELGDQAIDLTVVPAAGRPFHNLNYYPEASLAWVGDELWAADVYAPTISRVDPDTLAVRGHVDVGPWPVSLAYSEPLRRVAVVQRGNDTLGLVDSDAGRLVDAVWVGDEPASVRISPDGATAYVALATEEAIAVVDLASASVTARIATVRDPLALAISPDGARLYVASHRSGQPSRYPFPADPVADERDLDIIDLKTNEVTTSVRDLGTTITGLLAAPDGQRLWVAAIRNDTEISQIDDAAFKNTILALDAATGEELLAVDLDTQETSGGRVASPHQLALAGDTLWLAVEGSDLAIALDPDTLAELDRVPAPGRPRAVTTRGDVVHVHGAQSFSVTRITADNAVTAEIGDDPRPPAVAAGQALFTGAGLDFAEDRACNSCHADGVGDTLVWQTGPFPTRFVTRPIFWLEGTPEYGWDAYVTTLDSFAFGVTSNIGRRLVTAEQRGLAAYAASLMPPPRANGKTTRDGRMTEAALRGEALFTGQGRVRRLPPAPADDLAPAPPRRPHRGRRRRPGPDRRLPPRRVDEARRVTSLRAAVELALAYTGADLTADEQDDLNRYLEELTARDFILLASTPRAADELALVDRPITLTFSEPVWADPANLANIRLLTADGAEIPATITADGRHVTLTPAAALTADTAYTVEVAPEFESLREHPLYAATSVPFTTAAAPTLTLSGEYTWTVMFPGDRHRRRRL